MHGNVDILTVFEVLAQELMTTMSIVNSFLKSFQNLCSNAANTLGNFSIALL